MYLSTSGPDCPGTETSVYIHQYPTALGLVDQCISTSVPDCPGKRPAQCPTSGHQTNLQPPLSNCALMSGHGKGVAQSFDEPCGGSASPRCKACQKRSSTSACAREPARARRGTSTTRCASTRAPLPRLESARRPASDSGAARGHLASMVPCPSTRLACAQPRAPLLQRRPHLDTARRTLPHQGTEEAAKGSRPRTVDTMDFCSNQDFCSKKAAKNPAQCERDRHCSASRDGHCRSPRALLFRARNLFGRGLERKSVSKVGSTQASRPLGRARLAAPLFRRGPRPKAFARAPLLLGGSKKARRAIVNSNKASLGAARVGRTRSRPSAL
jgi:hypothetical protein